MITPLNAPRVALLVAILAALVMDTVCGAPSSISMRSRGRRFLRRKKSSAPSSTPTGMPSAKPSAKPSAMPSAKPSAMPSAKPSAMPSAKPSAMPSAKPSAKPSTMPTGTPTAPPTFPFLQFDNFLLVTFGVTPAAMTDEIEAAAILIRDVYNMVVEDYPNSGNIRMLTSAEIKTGFPDFRRHLSDGSPSDGNSYGDRDLSFVDIELLPLNSIIMFVGECQKNSCDPNTQLFFDPSDMDLPSLGAFYKTIVAALINMGGIGPILTITFLREYNQLEDITSSPSAMPSAIPTKAPSPAPTAAPVPAPTAAPVPAPTMAPVDDKKPSKSKKKKSKYD